MKNIIITGTNGMIGKLVLEECLKRSDVNKITSITRKPIDITHPKLVTILHNDFMDFSKVEDHFKNQDVCFYCLGVYTGAVSTDDFKKITVDYTKAFADVLRRNNEHATFCLLSGAGADSTQKSLILFAREKGIAENYLLKLKFKETYLFRPGYIYPVTPRVEPNFGYRVMRRIYKPVSKVYPDIGVTSTQLANKMVDVGLNSGDKIYYENKHIRE